jgi:hypothetical protein
MYNAERRRAGDGGYAPLHRRGRGAELRLELSTGGGPRSASVWGRATAPREILWRGGRHDEAARVKRLPQPGTAKARPEGDESHDPPRAGYLVPTDRGPGSCAGSGPRAARRPFQRPRQAPVGGPGGQRARSASGQNRPGLPTAAP